MGKTTWTPEMELYLKNNYPKMNISKIIKHLDKSYMSVKRKAQEMGVERDIYEDGLYLSTMEVISITGIAKTSIGYFVKKGYLNCKIMSSFNKNYKKFSANDIIEFMLKYPDRWLTKKYDRDYIMLMLLDYDGSKKDIETIRNYCGIGENSWRENKNKRK